MKIFAKTSIPTSAAFALALGFWTTAATAQVDLAPEPKADSPSDRSPELRAPPKPREVVPPPGAIPGAIPPSGPGQQSKNAEPGMMGLPFPKSQDDVPKTLQSLYAFLATEGDKRQGGTIGAAIERLWRYSGGDTVNLLIDRAEQFSMKNESERGLPFADAAVDLAPDYAEVWSHRAYLYYRMQNYNAALGDMRRALALDPNHFRALDGMAKILVLLGEKKAALAAYEKLLLVHPNIEGGKEALEDLKKEVEGRGI
jgi:tetratricopeptide (TPR) repeat protein